MPRRPADLINGRWTRVGVPVILAAGAALVIGVAANAGSSQGASTPAKAGGGTTTVQRRDLVATDTESGTLSYANPQTIFNRLTGTITWLPAIGEVIKPGGTLYKVSGQPVILMNGSVPAYRDLSEGVTDGLDVKELKANLVALGFDPNHQITVNNTFDAATTTAVEAWQASLGETQTGVVTLGDVVFLPGEQRITQVNTVLGSTGGASGGSGAGSTTGASLRRGAAQPEFVSLTTTTTTSTTSTTTSSSTTASGRNCPTATSVATASSVAAQRAASDCPLPNNPSQKSNSQELQLQALIALLKAETAELRQKGASGGTGGGGGTGGARSGTGSGGGISGASASGGRAGGAGAGGAGGAGGAAVSGSGSGSGAGAGTGSGSGSGATGSGGGAAQSILQSTSTHLVVTVSLDATKQSEAVVGEPVSVELPDGSSVDGKITEVSPVAQTSGSSGSSSGGGSGGSGGGSGGSGGSGSPSATIPVTIALTGHRHIHGLDQAAVSVNFEQQKAMNVLSVPVTALIATAGGGYAVQEAAAPHRLLPVTPGLFAAGYVQISGSQITPGLQVTDSQG